MDTSTQLNLRHLEKRYKLKISGMHTNLVCAFNKGLFSYLQDQYEGSMMKKKALEEELEDLEGKLLRAEKLLSGNNCMEWQHYSESFTSM